MTSALCSELSGAGYDNNAEDTRSARLKSYYKTVKLPFIVCGLSSCRCSTLIWSAISEVENKSKETCQWIKPLCFTVQSWTSTSRREDKLSPTARRQKCNGESKSVKPVMGFKCWLASWKNIDVINLGMITKLIISRVATVRILMRALVMIAGKAPLRKKCSKNIHLPRCLLSNSAIS